MDQALQGRIRELDGWRGVSILLVILGHVFDFTLPGVENRARLLYHVAFAGSELGVSIFFVISGFVITRLLIAEEAERGAISLKGFYTRRLFRIAPAFYLMILAVSLLGWAGWIDLRPAGVVYAALFLRDFRHAHFDWFLGHTWSLAVEEQFYLLFPLFWILIQPKVRATALVATFVLFLLWGSIFPWGFVFSGGALSGFSCVNAGALLAIFHPRARALAARVHPVLFALTAFFLLGRPLPHNGVGDSLYNLCLPFGVALILMYSTSRLSWVASTLKTAPLQWLGLVSYSAYLWQQLFLAPTAEYGSPAAARTFHLAAPAILPVAALSFYFLERPCNRLGRRISARFPASRSSLRSTCAATRT